MTVGIGFSLQKQYDLPITQVVSLLRKHGFSAVSPLWTPELDIASLATSVKGNDMIIQSIHAAYTDIDFLWQSESERGLSAFQNTIRSIDDCAHFDIPILVIHGWKGLVYTFPKTPLEFSLFDKIVQYAEKRSVSVAFENLEGEEYLGALMTRYQNLSNVGYCWDSGHDSCYPHKTDFLEKFGDRLIMTHINDNFGLRDANGIPSGDDDLHLIPYDGVIDWDKAVSRLKNAARQDILNFELKTVSHSKAENDLLYANLKLEDFIAKAGEKARIIAGKYVEGLDLI